MKLRKLGILGMLGILIATASIITMTKDKNIAKQWREKENIEAETKQLAEMSITYPDYRDLLYKLGVRQWQIGNIEAAKDAWEKAEYLDPNSSVAKQLKELPQ